MNQQSGWGGRNTPQNAHGGARFHRVEDPQRQDFVDMLHVHREVKLLRPKNMRLLCVSTVSKRDIIILSVVMNLFDINARSLDIW